MTQPRTPRSSRSDYEDPEAFARHLRRGQLLFRLHLLTVFLIGCVAAGGLLLQGGHWVEALLFPFGGVFYALFRMGFDRAV